MHNMCYRCGKPLAETKYLLKVSIYLGTSSERLPLCDICYQDLTNWFGRPFIEEGENKNDTE